MHPVLITNPEDFERFSNGETVTTNLIAFPDYMEVLKEGSQVSVHLRSNNSQEPFHAGVVVKNFGYIQDDLNEPRVARLQVKRVFD